MSKKAESEEPAGKNALEWAVFALSCLLVLGVIVALAMDAIRWEPGPARLEIKMDEAKVEEGQLRVPLSVVNRGASVAINVNVEVVGRGPQGDRTATVNFDFIPRDATREGVAIFPPDQDPQQLEGRISGYEKP